MKSQRIFLRLCRLIAVVLAIAAVFACNNKKPWTEADPEHWYKVTAEGREYVAAIEKVEGHKAYGYYYAADGPTVAARQEFELNYSRHKLMVTSDEGRLVLNPSKVTIEELPTLPEFVPEDARLYRQPFCAVEIVDDVVYGHASGYWTSLPGVEAEVSKVFTDGFAKSFKRHDLDLTMDIYSPQGIEGPKPFILFVHGGAFYVGDKQEPAYRDFCIHYASMGYVCASINYRMGFHLGKGAIERAAYMAVQDAHAAMRYIVANADKYGIDKDRLFAAGSSAGSIAALNMAFMADKDRPESSRGGSGFLKMHTELGGIASSGNEIVAPFHVRAVANLWGAVSSVDILSNSKTDIISFHGDADEVVPYGEGLPFSMAGKLVASTLSDPMFGSECIDAEARRLGLKSEFHPYPGKGHAFNTTGPDKQPNADHYQIRAAIDRFFFEEMVPANAKLRPAEGGWYEVVGDVDGVSWSVVGGFVMEVEDRRIRILWRGDEPEHTVSATGRYLSGLGYLFNYEEPVGK